MERLSTPMKKIVLTLLLMLPLSACSWSGGGSGEEEPPVSISAPIANLEFIFHSAPGLDGDVRITGLAGSVSGGSLVTVDNQTNGAGTSVVADSTGTFQVEIASRNGDTIELSVDNGSDVASTSFVVSSTDPTPLDVQQTDVSVFQSDDLAFVTVTGSSTVSLVQINLSSRQVTNSYLLSDPDTGEGLTDLTAIEIFENARIALLLDRTRLKFYLIDLNSMTVKEDPIEVTGNFATIVGQNEVSLKVTIKDVTENETLIRNGITSALTVLNEQITTLPDTSTPLTLNGQIGPSTTHLLVAGTFAADGVLKNFTIQNSDLAILSETSLLLSSATLSGLGVYASRTMALVGNQNEQSGLGESRVVYVCDLSRMERTNTLIVDGIPEEMTVAADETRIYLTQFNTHDVAEISTSTLSVEQTFETGPNPTRVALGSNGNLITVLNKADTTVSLLNL